MTEKYGDLLFRLRTYAPVDYKAVIERYFNVSELQEAAAETDGEIHHKCIRMLAKMVRLRCIELSSMSDQLRAEVANAGMAQCLMIALPSRSLEFLQALQKVGDCRQVAGRLDVQAAAVGALEYLAQRNSNAAQFYPDWSDWRRLAGLS